MPDKWRDIKTEADLREWAKAKYEAQGWHVISASSERRMPTGLDGLSDHIVLAPDTVLFVEYKAPGGHGQVRDSQIEFMLVCRKYRGRHLRHYIVEHPMQVLDIIKEVAQELQP